MHSRKEGGLKLNSYKIDNSQLQQDLKLLSDMKEALETTVSQHKFREEKLLVENERLKEQIKMLQNKFMEKPDHSICLSKILKLENQLKQYKKKNENLRMGQEWEKKNNEELVRKLEKLRQDNENRTTSYQQRIEQLEKELKDFRINKYTSYSQRNVQPVHSETENIKIFDYEKPKNTRKQKNDTESSSNQMAPMIYSKKDLAENPKKSDDQYSVKRSNNIIKPPKSPTYTNFRSQNDPLKPQISKGASSSGLSSISLKQQELEDVVKLIYQEAVKNLGLSAKEITVLPSFKKLKLVDQPTPDDLKNFFQTSPIQERNITNAKNKANMLRQLVEKKYGKVTGGFVTEYLISRVQQYSYKQDSESNQNLNQSDYEISGMTPSSSRFSGSKLRPSLSINDNLNHSDSNF